MFEDQQTNNPPQNEEKVEDMFASTDAVPSASRDQGALPQTLISTSGATPPTTAPPPGPPSALSQGKLRPAEGAVSGVPAAQLSPAPKGSPLKKGLLISLIVIVVGGGAGAGFLWWQNGCIICNGAPTDADSNINLAPIDIEPQSTAPQEPSQSALPEPSTPTPIPSESSEPEASIPAPINMGDVERNRDSDGDGLRDVEELEYGTNVGAVDTDFDGLSDFEEVAIFGTDPLNPDTDNDGYQDGFEVQNGYNPAGPGKLLEF